jgi:hypothetical protein
MALWTCATFVARGDESAFRLSNVNDKGGVQVHGAV